MIDIYFADRSSKGFNAALIRAPDNRYGPNVPANIHGDQPFVGEAFRSALNPDYWRHVTYMADAALRSGITLVWNPAYLGVEDAEGWSQELKAASNTDLVQYGRSLASRYSHYPNIIWYLGHDRDPDLVEESRLNSLGRALKSGTDHLITVGGVYNTGRGASRQWDLLTFEPDFDTLYHYLNPVEQMASARTDAPGVPIVLLESAYEQEHGGLIGDQRQRYQTWGTFCAGGAGAVFGNNPIWHFDSGGLFPHYFGNWQSNLDYAGSQHQAVFNRFVSSLDGSWSATTPELARQVVLDGFGSGELAAAARFSHDLGVMYLPTSRDVILDLEAMSVDSRFTAEVLDPTNGQVVSSLGPYGASTVHIPAAGLNDFSDTDWVLVVRNVKE